MGDFRKKHHKRLYEYETDESILKRNEELYNSNRDKTIKNVESEIANFWNRYGATRKFNNNIEYMENETLVLERINEYLQGLSQN